MSPHDFLATCKMGCYDALSGLAALTALHVTGAAAAAPGTQGAAGGPAAAAAAAGAGAEDAAGAGLGAGPGAGGFAGALGMAGGPGAGPSGSMRREPHLNFIQNLESLQVGGSWVCAVWDGLAHGVLVPVHTPALQHACLLGSFPTNPCLPALATPLRCWPLRR